jgi:hypothetical protein
VRGNGDRLQQRRLAGQPHASANSVTVASSDTGSDTGADTGTDTGTNTVDHRGDTE